MSCFFVAIAPHSGGAAGKVGGLLDFPGSPFGVSAGNVN
jgi:hypothetical protein